MNIGIKSALSPYIVRVDSDDFVNKKFLEFLYYYLETNPGTDAVACDYLLLDENEVLLERKDCEKFPIACGIMFKKDYLILFFSTSTLKDSIDDDYRFDAYKWNPRGDNRMNYTEVMDFFSYMLGDEYDLESFAQIIKEEG